MSPATATTTPRYNQCREVYLWPEESFAVADYVVQEFTPQCPDTLVYPWTAALGESWTGGSGLGCGAPEAAPSETCEEFHPEYVARVSRCR